MNRLSFALLAAAATPVTASAQDAAASPVLEEIIVVAQKREQSAQDVGISIAALPGRQLLERGIDQPEDLYRLVPNVALQNNGGGGAPVLIVRGIGLQSFRINDTPTTAFYVDDVYQPSVASAEWTLFDVERVEVLKGPQGGLYGRNAIGAAVQIISRAPEPGRRQAYVSVGTGEFVTGEIEGGATFTLSDRLALRVAGRILEGGDSPYRSVTGGFDHGAEERRAGRASLRLTPSDRVDLVVRVHGGGDDTELEPLRPVGVYADIGDAAALGAPDVSLALIGGLQGRVPQPLCAAVSSGRRSDPDTCSTATGLTPAQYGLRADDVRASASDFPGFLDSSWYGTSVFANIDIGRLLLQSITAYDSIDYRRFQDFDGHSALHLHIDYNTRIRARSQELRLSSAGDGRVLWTVGVNYAQDDLVEDSPLYGAEGVLPLLFGGAVFSPQNYDQDADALAAYGHVEWRWADEWNLIGELRYTDTETSFVGGARLGFPSGATVPFVGTDDRASFDALSGKLAVEWTPGDDLLAFAGVSRGFKTGGFFGGFPTSVAQLAPFDEETVWSLELGIKSDWLDDALRLNASLFFYDRRDVQQNAGDPTSPVNIKRIMNIGDVETFGAEADLTWLASERLALSVGVGVVDAEVSDSRLVQAASVPLLPDAPMEGTNIPNYSDVSATFVGRYEAPLGLLRGFVQLEGRYQSEQDLSVISHAVERGVFTEPGYAVWNLRVGLGSADGRWQAQAFLANAADEEYRVLARNDGAFGVHELYGWPRTWGVRFLHEWE
ncbi:MAG: TonB-dependent receptor [Gammaproteobacteria bacterium]|nr:TonB-dependent receptor [Gammaproteobacteria bacterium]